MEIPSFQHCGPGYLFAGKIGTTTEINKKTYENGILKVLPEKTTVTHGIVELPKVNTWEERHKATFTPGTGDLSLPILDQMVDNEIDWLYSHQGWRRQQNNEKPEK